VSNSPGKVQGISTVQGTLQHRLSLGIADASAEERLIRMAQQTETNGIPSTSSLSYLGIPQHVAGSMIFYDLCRAVRQRRLTPKFKRFQLHTTLLVNLSDSVAILPLIHVLINKKNSLPFA
jgi:hypothetical protein